MPHQTPLSRERLLNKVLYYIKYRMRSQKEVENKLRMLGAEPELRAEITELLKEYGLIDDEKVITASVKECLDVKGLGLARAKRELTLKGFSPHLIEDALQNYCDESGYSETEQAYAWISRRLGRSAELPEDQKILASLGRKGFSYPAAAAALAQYKRERTEPD